MNPDFLRPFPNDSRSPERSLSSRAVEQLESRTLLTVALDSAGWTQVTPSADSRMIYVSSSAGSDNNSGLSPDAPVATLARGYGLLRDNEPDWLLLKRGDTFNESFEYFSDSGRSAQEPMVVTNYGDPTLPRPVIDSGANTAFRTGTGNHDLYVIGLNFTTSTHNPTSPNYTGEGSYGFYDLGGSSDLLIEDCAFSYFVNDITFQGFNGALNDVSIRRNQILDAYNVGGHSQGLYADSVNNLTIQENVFDHDGWNETVPNGGATIYNHDCYLHSSNTHCVVTGNIFANAGSFGLQARAGGIVDNNFFVGDPYGFAFGLVNGSTIRAGGVSGEAIGNVVIQPRHDATGWGIGAMIGNLAPGGNTVVSNNIFADAGGGNAPALSFAPGHAVANARQEAGLHSVTVENNTAYRWGFGVSMSAKYVAGAAGADGISDVVIRDNNFQDNDLGRIVSHGNAFDPGAESWSGNTYSSSTDPSQWFTLQNGRASFAAWQATVEPTAIVQTVPFADPTRTADTYLAALGQDGAVSGFIPEARDLNKSNWNPLYLAGAINSYIQGGFTLNDGATPRSVNPDPAPTAAPAPDPAPSDMPASVLGPVQPLATVSAPATDPAEAVPTAAVATDLPSAATTSAPVLSRVTPNYTGARHTTLDSISLVFSQPVTSGAAMVSLTSTTLAGSTPVMTLVSNPSGDGKNWRVTLLGQPTDAAAGVSYTLTVHGDSITNAAGQSLGADISTIVTTTARPGHGNGVVPPAQAVNSAKARHLAHSMRLTTRRRHVSV